MLSPADEPITAGDSAPPQLSEVLERLLPSGQATDEHGSTGKIDPELVKRTLAVLGIKSSRGQTNLEPIMEVLEAGQATGLDLDTLFAAAQAYGRGVGRVVDAEVELTRLLVRATSPERRADVLDSFLASIVPLASRLFEVLHTGQLRDGLTIALSDTAIDEPAVSPRAVALVDLVDSTGFLASATPEETERLVDSLCDAATACIATREVVIVKYLGDGFIMVARDADEVAGAAMEAVQALGRSCHRLPARAGLAVGPLTRRAGDYFGFAVNKAQRLASQASPNTVLVDVAVELKRSPDFRRRGRVCCLRGLDEPVACIELSPGDAVAG
jgi:class 3 adenylate cyclase